MQVNMEDKKFKTVTLLGRDIKVPIDLDIYAPLDDDFDIDYFILVSQASREGYVIHFYLGFYF